MGIVGKIIFVLVGNALGLYVATKYVPGFQMSLDLTDLLITALTLSAINAFIRPVIKMVLSPIIFVTLGVASILVNIATLKLLDYLLTSVTITDIGSLILATVVIGTVNFLIHILF